MWKCIFIIIFIFLKIFFKIWGFFKVKILLWLGNFWWINLVILKFFIGWKGNNKIKVWVVFWKDMIVLVKVVKCRGVSWGWSFKFIVIFGVGKF